MAEQQKRRRGNHDYSAAAKKAWTPERRAKLKRQAEQRRRDRAHFARLRETIGAAAAARAEKNWDRLKEQAQRKPVPVAGQQAHRGGATMQSILDRIDAAKKQQGE